MQVSTIIAEARRRADMSMRELSESTGVTAAAISEIETSKRDPRASTVNLLLGVLNVQLIPVKTNRIDPKINAKRLEQVLALAENLPRRKPSPTLKFPPFRTIRKP